MVKASKVDELAAKFRKTKPFIEFLLESIAQKYDLSNSHEKEKAAKEAKEILELPSRIFEQEHRRLAAAILKLPMDFLKLSKKQSASASLAQKYDPAEAAAIKTMLKNHAFLDMALNRIEEGMFEYHRDLFALIIAGDFDSPALFELEGSEYVKEMSEDELISFLIAKRRFFTTKRSQKSNTPKPSQWNKNLFICEK